MYVCSCKPCVRHRGCESVKGELLPPEKGGMGNKLAYPIREFSRNTIAAYRKLAEEEGE